MIHQLALGRSVQLCVVTYIVRVRYLGFSKHGSVCRADWVRSGDSGFFFLFFQTEYSGSIYINTYHGIVSISTSKYPASTNYLLQHLRVQAVFYYTRLLITSIERTYTYTTRCILCV